MNDPLIQKLETYKPDQSAIDLIKSTKILLLVGPTGAGKDYLKETLLTTGDYHHLVSHTTRTPRINHGILEEDGREYFFITKERAEEMIDNHEFVEVKMYSNNIYGTSVAEIQAAHDEDKVAITDVEVKGVNEYKELDGGVMTVFLLPPSFDVWLERLSRRYGDVIDVEDQRRRFETALKEIDELLAHNYYAVLVSDDVKHSAEEVQKYIETCKQDPEYVKFAHDVARKLAEDIHKYLRETLHVED